MAISAFAHATGLSPRALRSYDRLGLLRPAHVDPQTRYRMYAPDQVGRGKTIRMLRELGLPLLEIGGLLEASPVQRRGYLLRHQRRLALRSVEIKHALGRLQTLIEGKDELMDDLTVDPVDEATHRRLAIDLFNRSWQLLEQENRTPEQDAEMIHVAHAARFHWGEIGSAAQRARGENQCARIYSTLRRSEPALYHANRALELVRAGGDGFEDWDLATALEVLARAHLSAANRAEAEHYCSLAKAELETIADPDDREIIASQIAELNL